MSLVSANDRGLSFVLTSYNSLAFSKRLVKEHKNIETFIFVEDEDNSLARGKV